MKSGVQVALALGLSVLIALVAIEGAGEIAGLLAGAGWVLLLLAPLQVLPMLLDAMGWRALIRDAPGILPVFAIASVRQAVNRLLPVANVGGEIVGIRLLTKLGVTGAVATASVIVEVMLTLAAQFLFVAMGVVCLFSRTAHAPPLNGLLAGLAAGMALVAVMFVVLRHGKVFSRLEPVALRLFGRWLEGRRVAEHGALVDGGIGEILAARPRLFRSVGWQLASLVVGCSESWLALRWLGHPVDLAGALVLESLAQAARSVFFMVPASLGVQEAGLIGAGYWFGVAPDVAIALSLAKRMRELVYGVPVLVAWQWITGRRLVRRRGLDVAALERYARRGWISMPGFFTATEVAQIARYTDQVRDLPEVSGAHMVYREPSLLEGGARVIQRIEDFCPHHDGFDRLIRDGRLQRVIEQLLAAPAVLFKEKINFKMPGGGGFEAHQDQQAGWSVYAPLFVTAMVSIDAATVANGCLEMSMAPRQSKLVGREWAPLSGEETAGLNLEPLPTRPGDVLFFDSYVPHASKANLTGEQRRILYLTYNRRSDGDHRRRYYDEKRANFPPDVDRVPGREYRFRV